MHAEIRRYNIVIHGRVQDIGLRDLVARMADFLRLRGYVFNDVDGSVRIVVEGVENTVESFLEDVINKTKNIGAEIAGVEKREISRDSDLPPRFIKIPSTELEEIGRKLDLGVETLRSMDAKLSKLDELDRLKKLDELDRLKKLDELDRLKKLDELEKLDTIAEGQEKMLEVLKSIEEKL
jgi:acylphosphatase